MTATPETTGPASILISHITDLASMKQSHLRIIHRNLNENSGDPIGQWEYCCIAAHTAPKGSIADKPSRRKTNSKIRGFFKCEKLAEKRHFGLPVQKAQGLKDTHQI